MILALGGGGTLLLLLGSLLVWGTHRRGNGPRVHPRQAGPVEDTRRERRAREGDREREREVGDGETCPICLGTLVDALDTNCGHRFCAECALAYWQHDQWPRAARCAVCRRHVSPPPPLPPPSPSLPIIPFQVTLLLPVQPLTSAQLSRQVTDYNHRMSDQPRPVRLWGEGVRVCAGEGVCWGGCEAVW